MRKKSVIILMVLMLFVSFGMTANAAPGDKPWKKTIYQPMGYDIVAFKTTDFTKNKVFGKVRSNSEANQVAITVHKHQALKHTSKVPYMKVQVWDMDKYGKNDFIGNFTFYPDNGKSKTYYFDEIYDFDDGFDSSAEIFLVYTSNYTGSPMTEISYKKVLRKDPYSGVWK